MLSYERLYELLRYDPMTGCFRWVVARRGPRMAGRVAGERPADGDYIRITIDMRRYQAHRLAWLYVYGEWPGGSLDHIDGNRQNNRIDNLREASPSKNNQNRRRADRGSKTGVLGVSPSRGRFIAFIKAGGKNINLGRYPTIELASDAYVRAKRQMHEGCTL